MELSPKEQVAQLLKKKGKILLTTHVKPDGDAISSTLAFYLILKKLGKEDVTIASTDPLPEVFSFLPSYEKFIQKYGFPTDLVISLDCTNANVDKLRWNKKGNILNILVTPSEGEFAKKDITFDKSKNAFSVIITLDAADVSQLGKVYANNTEMFSESTIVNIDHHVSNTNYGTINLIDPKSASTTEVIFSLIETLEQEFGVQLMDENIATLLLTGIITDTGSFQNPNTTPKSFEIAADLIEYGARQQEIIRKLFKTKNLTTLKLWGKVLSKIKNDPVHRFVWSTVSLQDLQESKATSDELAGILDDLLSSAPGAEVVLLIKEREDEIVAGSLRTTSNAIDAVEIAEMFGGGGHRQAAGFKIPKKSADFKAITNDVVSKIQDYQARRLGIEPEDRQKPDFSVKNERKGDIKQEVVLDFDQKAEQKKSVDLNNGLSKSKKEKKEEVSPDEILANAKKAVENFSLEKESEKSSKKQAKSVNKPKNNKVVIKKNNKKSVNRNKPRAKNLNKKVNKSVNKNSVNRPKQQKKDN